MNEASLRGKGSLPQASTVMLGREMMHTAYTDTHQPMAPMWPLGAYEYLLDRGQRWILFLDILRKRGNNYLAHLKAGQPPVLVFDYEMVLDGRTFEQPVNYSLIRILDRRTPATDKKPVPHGQADRRRAPDITEDEARRPKRPIVVIDPRAGHGPGIGGSKLNSQIGIALQYGHPVYFITFYTNPEPGQTISDVERAEIRFLEEIHKRHPDTPRPAIIGNCQAGWAAALIGADRPDLTGPLIFNGSPLSYWGGVEGANPMRYKGGLCGGVWLTSLWCDLGNGKFDGANLVAGFEDLNPANTYWKKYYHLFSNVDTEEKRFLNFEKWWGGFFKMNTEEIHFITKSLFIGNELEQGRLQLDDGKSVHLKDFKDPILVFASGGDNITPPPQALNWIKKVYGTVEEIKSNAQVIIYMVHEHIGHLGIFVSGKVARKEHRQIIGSLDMVEYLSPGLYEMIIERDASAPELDDYQVRFEPRTMEDILALDDGLEDESAFVPVDKLSRFNDAIYQLWWHPWLNAIITEQSAKAIRMAHPLRIQRNAVSDLNPFCLPLKWWARAVAPYRVNAAAENPYVKMEALAANTIETGWNIFRDLRDATQQFCFKTMYDNPWMKAFLGSLRDVNGEQEKEFALDEETLKRRKAWVEMAAKEGGFVEAVIRIFIAVAGANRSLDRRQFKEMEKIARSHERLNRLSEDHYKVIIKEQSRVLDLNPQKAIDGLAVLLTNQKERREAFDIARKIALVDKHTDTAEAAMLDRIGYALGMEDMES